MLRVTSDRAWPLHDVDATRALEHAAAAALPAHTLMQRAGLATARLALALAPHGKVFWIACGPGNNGGDGLEAALHLRQWGKQAVVTWSGDEARAPADAAASFVRARSAGVALAAEPPAQWDLAVDAMLGLGSSRPLEGSLAAWAQTMGHARSPVLAVDLPSGLDANTGTGHAVRASHTLSLLSLKPGLFTGGGRDAAGQVWLDSLGVEVNVDEPSAPTAWLGGRPLRAPRAHASHKGSYGDVAVIGGAHGMTGAALLASRAALNAGAGRVFGALLSGAIEVDAVFPELMMRSWDSLDLSDMAVACGCGGGDAIRAVLPKVLSTARSLVLDADALNAIATDSQLQSLIQARARRGRDTIITPHPLEAARLLGCATSKVQGNRLESALALVRRFNCIVVLKGSGTVIAGPGQVPVINPTGNARLATAGTGDVLAGLIAARLASGSTGMDAAAAAVFSHGLAADTWPGNLPLTAGALATRVPWL
jgi:hydroxyethylthiazole kinase-like uncharacterized protein yjeF